MYSLLRVSLYVPQERCERNRFYLVWKLDFKVLINNYSKQSLQRTKNYVCTLKNKRLIEYIPPKILMEFVWTIFFKCFQNKS